MAHEMSRLIEKRKKKGKLFIPVILKIVSQESKIPLSNLEEKNRKREIVQARQLAMFMGKKYTNASLNDIGKAIAGKDHATVLHAIKVIKGIMESPSNGESEVKLRHLYRAVELGIINTLDGKNNLVCAICGSMDVSINAWINPNTHIFEKHLSVDESSLTDTKCRNCNAYTELIIEKDFRKYDG